MKKYLLSLIICLFASAALMSQVLVEEGFNGTFPADWMSTGNASDGGWAIHTSASIASTYWGAPDPADGTTFVGTNDDACNCDKSEDRLILPTQDLTTAPDFLFLSFDKYYFNLDFQNVFEKLTVEVSYDGGTSWEEVHEIAGNEAAVWTNEVVNISSLRREAAVMIAFRYNDFGSWLYAAGLDNIRLYAPKANDVRLAVDNFYKYTALGNTVNVTGTVTNVGGENLTSVDVTLDNGMGTLSDNLTGLDLAPLETANFSIEVPVNQPIQYNLGISAMNPNGVADEDMSNNNADSEIVGVENPPSKMVFVEESTGTWCPWCPRGAVFMDRMEENYAESIAGVAVHVGVPNWPDPMEVPVYGQTYAQTVTGFPTIVVDRNIVQNIPGYTDMLARGAELRDFSRNRPSPIGLSAEAVIDPNTNQMMIDITATAHSTLDNSVFSLVTLITEDHVTGDGFDYRQANNYANNAVEFMGGWEVLPNPASGNDIEFNHTLRAAPDGFSGTATIIPASTIAGESYSYSTTYDIPAGYDNTNMNVTILVLDLNNNGVALNTTMVREVGFPSAVEEIEELAGFNTYPNPVQDQINIELNFTENLNYNIQVIDVLGNKVMDLGQFNNNRINESFDVAKLAPGMYFIAVHTEEGQNVMKFTKL